MLRRFPSRLAIWLLAVGLSSAVETHAARATPAPLWVAPPARTALPLNGLSRTGNDVTVAAVDGGAYPADLRPGHYGRVRIEAGAEIVLTSGEYSFDALVVAEGAVVWLDPCDAAGDEGNDPIALRVLRDFEIGPGAEFAFIDPATNSTRDIEIMVLRKGRLTIPEDAIVRGTLLAPRAKVTFREGSRLEGAVFADRLRFEPGVAVVYHERAGF